MKEGRINGGQVSPGRRRVKRRLELTGLDTAKIRVYSVKCCVSPGAPAEVLIRGGWEEVLLSASLEALLSTNGDVCACV